VALIVYSCWYKSGVFEYCKQRMAANAEMTLKRLIYIYILILILQHTCTHTHDYMYVYLCVCVCNLIVESKQACIAARTSNMLALALAHPESGQDSSLTIHLEAPAHSMRPCVCLLVVVVAPWLLDSYQGVGCRQGPHQKETSRTFMLSHTLTGRYPRMARHLRPSLYFHSTFTPPPVSSPYASQSLCASRVWSDAWPACSASAALPGCQNWHCSTPGHAEAP
jgi:hypothetical protein